LIFRSYLAIPNRRSKNVKEITWNCCNSALLPVPIPGAYLTIEDYISALYPVGAPPAVGTVISYNAAQPN
jgi:hypothetical protein